MALSAPPIHCCLQEQPEPGQWREPKNSSGSYWPQVQVMPIVGHEG